MQRESPSFFLVIRNRQIYFFSPKKWKTDPLGPVIKEVQFTGSFSRPLADVARHRVSPGRTSIPRTLDRVSRLKIARSHNHTQRARVRENFPEIKNRSLARENLCRTPFSHVRYLPLSHVWKIPNRFAPCAPKFAHGTRRRKKSF